MSKITLKRCMNCGNPYSPKKSKLEKFCSIVCKNKFKNKQKDDEEWMKKQGNIDFKARKKERESDYRLSRRRI